MTVLDPGSEVGVVVSALAQALGVQRLVLLQRRGLTRMWRVACLLDSGDVIWRKRLQLFMFDSRTIKQLQPRSSTSPWNSDWFISPQNSSNRFNLLPDDLSGGTAPGVLHAAIREWEARLPFRGLEVEL